jgi:hypothetical protein
MPQQLLVLVHGMGPNPDGWSADVVAALDAAAARYAAFANGPPFSQRIHVAEIRYEDCFSDIVAQWQAQSAALAAWAQASGRPLPTVVQWLDTVLPASDAAAKAFFWSTAVHPLLYRAFPLVRDRVREGVMSRLVQILAGAGAQATAVTIVAHSLGAVVMHDVLDMLGTGHTPPSVGDTSMLAPPNWTAANLFMVADPCLLGPPAVRDIDYLGSICRPVDGAAPGDCQRFYEVWHACDPVAVTRPFRPTTWGHGYREIGPLGHFRQANVHAFTHYVDHPAVHVPIVNQSLGGPVIDAAEAAAARAAYPDITSPECAAEIAQLKASVQAFAGLGDDLERLSIQIAELHALALSAAERCLGLTFRER